MSQNKVRNEEATQYKHVTKKWKQNKTIITKLKSNDSQGNR